MAFVTGLMLIDAPASALNNLGSIPGARTDNTVGVKVIRAGDGAYPYVSAQAFRYWLRRTLEGADIGWKAAPVYREEKVAFTEANPIKWWDDDLFGYMRASKGSGNAARRKAAAEAQDAARFAETVTRVSPFRVSTLVSIAPVTITDDFGTMTRQEGDPVIYEHQFYRTTLRGLYSLDLQAAGSFTVSKRTGFQNLDSHALESAKAAGITPDENGLYRLPVDERLKRVTALFEGLAHLEGGAKQSLHYTDVAPALVVMAVTKGGNHIFGHVIGANPRRLPQLKIEALEEALTVFADDILSDVYVGWVQGYLDEERVKLEEFTQTAAGAKVRISHPREAYAALIEALRANPNWLLQ